MTDQHSAIHAFLALWTGAELTGDQEELGPLLTDDFTGIGPLGFTLPRHAWLQRHAPDALTYESFALDEVVVRELGPTAALVTARLDSVGAFGGNPVPTTLRLTAILTSESGEWQLAHNHLSFVAGTPGSPALPGRG